MSWLTRSSSTNSHAPPIRISHSKSSTISHIKHGTLGSGVTIVRTPQEALAGSGVSVDTVSDQEFDHEEAEDSDPAEHEHEHEEDEGEELEDDEGETHQVRVEQAERPVPPAYSPPRSSLPLSKSTPTLPLKDAHRVRPTRRPPPIPSAQDAAVLSQKKLPPPPLSSQFPTVPTIPAHLSPPSTPPPFGCILLSPVPPNAIDFSKVLVTLETCTATHRTTFNTLMSRPSHLANYLKSLFAEVDDESDLTDSASLYSRTENGSFSSIFHNHLTSSGLLSPSSLNVHIFLDRASAPYDHILAYLRSPPTTVDHVASLSPSFQLHAGNPARLEALLALRDEAAFLDLPELVQLCATELRRISNGHALQLSRSAPHVLAHTRGPSNGSMRSMDTLREYDEQDAGFDADSGSASTCRDSIGSAKSLGSIRGHGLGHATVGNGAATAKEKEEQPHHLQWRSSAADSLARAVNVPSWSRSSRRRSADGQLVIGYEFLALDNFFNNSAVIPMVLCVCAGGTHTHLMVSGLLGSFLHLYNSSHFPRSFWYTSHLHCVLLLYLSRLLFV
ncbi:hypothetical protein EI94DRAFT_1833333 [Lactarius quietus]|nr:hypothetical protein EI94DRAFT_1833333 [Lactarius quietus]